jgi:hypothetical protein
MLPDRDRMLMCAGAPLPKAQDQERRNGRNGRTLRNAARRRISVLCSKNLQKRPEFLQPAGHQQTAGACRRDGAQGGDGKTMPLSRWNARTRRVQPSNSHQPSYPHRLIVEEMGAAENTIRPRYTSPPSRPDWAEEKPTVSRIRPRPPGYNRLPTICRPFWRSSQRCRLACRAP